MYVRMHMEEEALRTYLSPESGFHPQWHPSSRTDRFPDAEERVRMYMSDWYLPPCSPAGGRGSKFDGRGGGGGMMRWGFVQYRYEREEYGSSGRSTGAKSLRIEFFNVSTMADGGGGGDQGGEDGALSILPHVRPDWLIYLSPSHLKDCARRPFRVSFDKYVIHGLLRPFSGAPPDYGLVNRLNMRSYCVDSLDFGPLLEAAAGGEEGDGGGGTGALASRADDVITMERWAAALPDRGIGAVLKRAALARRRRMRGGGGGVRRLLTGDSLLPPPPQPQRPPVLIQFGDRPAEPPLPFPHFMKFRPAIASKGDDGSEGKVTDGGNGSAGCVLVPADRPRLVTPSRFAPALWRLESHRHYNFLRHIPLWDMPWEEKLDMAVWRGGLTGFRLDEMNELSPGQRDALTPGDICKKYSERCRLVLSAGRSEIIDAGFIFLNQQGENIPDVIDGVSLLKPRMSIPQLLRCKVLISLQGNDVASGLKWSLFSRSVVLMPPPTVTSWAMEERLVPWVHYVPLEGLDGAEERVRWVLSHQEEARRIAERATLWIWDMFFHEEAVGDEMEVKTEIVRRYGKYFRESV